MIKQICKQLLAAGGLVVSGLVIVQPDVADVSYAKHPLAQAMIEELFAEGFD